MRIIVNKVMYWVDIVIKVIINVSKVIIVKI